MWTSTILFILFYSLNPAHMLQLTQCNFNLNQSQVSATGAHTCWTCDTTDWKNMLCLTWFHGFFYLQLPSIHDAKTNKVTQHCQISASDPHMHCNWPHRDVASQSVATYIPGFSRRRNNSFMIIMPQCILRNLLIIINVVKTNEFIIINEF